LTFHPTFFLGLSHPILAKEFLKIKMSRPRVMENGQKIIARDCPCATGEKIKSFLANLSAQR